MNKPGKVCLHAKQARLVGRSDIDRYLNKHLWQRVEVAVMVYLNSTKIFDKKRINISFFLLHLDKCLDKERDFFFGKSINYTYLLHGAESFLRS